MVLARALLALAHGPDWILTDDDLQQPYSSYRKIVRQFGDTPTAAFSLHRLVRERFALSVR